MKDHKPIFSRGSRYVESALNNWNKRSSRLMEVWYDCHSTINKKRIENLIFVLRHRMIGLLKMLNKFQEKQKALEHEREQILLHVECPDRMCKFNPGTVTMAIKLNHFEDGKYTCTTCGRPLVPRENQHMKEELAGIGITFSG